MKNNHRYIIVFFLLWAVACGGNSQISNPTETVKNNDVPLTNVVIKETVEVLVTVVAEETVIVLQEVPVTLEPTATTIPTQISTLVPTQTPSSTPAPVLTNTENAPISISLQFDDLPFRPQSIVFDGSSFWVGGLYRDVVLKIDPMAGTIANVIGLAKYGVGVPDLAFDGTYIWALVHQSVIKINAITGDVIDTYYLNFDESGFYGQSILYTDNNLWIGGRDRDILIKFDPIIGETIQVIPLAKYGAGIPDLVTDGTFIYAPVNESLIKVDISTGSIGKTYYYNFDSSPFYPQSLVSDGTYIWAGGKYRDLSVGIGIDTEYMRIIQLGKKGTGVPSLYYFNNFLWASMNGSVLQIDVEYGEILNQTSLSPGPLLLSSDADSIWIAIVQNGNFVKP